MTNKIWYTAREIFDSEYGVDFSWDEYIKWSKLTHLTELVSLDGILNGLAFEPDFDSEEDWKHFVIEEHMITKFFKSIDYVLEKTKDIAYYNLLAVMREPHEPKMDVSTHFDFIGYDLIERGGNISALTNCGGFDETFLPGDLNQFGLIHAWTKAKKIQKDLRIHNPEEPHADCYLYEVWRHKTIGRKHTKSHHGA